MTEKKVISNIYNIIQNADDSLQAIGDIEKLIHDFYYSKGDRLNKFIRRLGWADYYFVMDNELHTLNSDKAILKGRFKIVKYLIGEYIEMRLSNDRD